MASFSTMPPGWPMAGRVWRFTMLTPWTRTRLSLGRSRRTSPVLPLSLPAMTTTLSPFLLFALLMSLDPGSQHFRGERDDLHELAGAQLARHRSEDARADRLALLVDEHRRVAVEADGAAVRPANLLRRAHDHRLMDVALLDAAARDRLLDRDDDDVADRRRPAMRAAQHLDALDAARAGIVGNVEIGLHLDHGRSTFPGRSRGGGGRFGAGEHDPALALGNRLALLDAHDVAGLVDVLLVMRGGFLRAHDDLLVDRVHDAALDANDDRLVAGVADDHTLQDAFRHDFCSYSYEAVVPLPLPMRTSAGFCDTGTSGKMRIQTRPMRRMWRVMARRAASIWRAETRPGSAALRPNEPKFSVVPPLARPWMRPLWPLRYFVRFGLSMVMRPLS